MPAAMNRHLCAIVLLTALLPGCQLFQPTPGADPNEPSQIVTTLHELGDSLEANTIALMAQADPNTAAGQVAGQMAAALATGQQVVETMAVAAQAAIDEAAKPQPDYGPVITSMGAMVAPMTGPAAPWVLLGTTLAGALVSIVQTLKKKNAQATTADIVTAIESAKVLTPKLAEAMADPQVKAALKSEMLPTTKTTVKAIKGS